MRPIKLLEHIIQPVNLSFRRFTNVKRDEQREGAFQGEKLNQEEKLLGRPLAYNNPTIFIFAQTFHLWQAGIYSYSNLP